MTAMYRERRDRRRSPSPHQRLLVGHDDDPLSGVANLFDAAMVFAVALMLAMAAHFRMPELLSAQSDFAIVKHLGESNMEIIIRKGRKLEHYRISRQRLGGEGEKLGTAYRLKSGEVIYVPEP